MDYCGGLEPLPGGNGLGVILVVVSVEGFSATGETVYFLNQINPIQFDLYIVCSKHHVFPLSFHGFRVR